MASVWVPTNEASWQLPMLLGALAREVDLSREANFATWFSSSLLLLCAIFAYLTARRYRGVDRRLRLVFALIAAGAVLLSFDDIAQVHERVEAELRPVLRKWSGGGVSAPMLGAMFAGSLALMLAILALGPLLRAIRRDGARWIIAIFAVLAVSAVSEVALMSLDHARYPLLPRIEVAIEEGGELVAILLFLRFLQRQFDVAGTPIPESPIRGNQD